jgi:hypothetical protein
LKKKTLDNIFHHLESTVGPKAALAAIPAISHNLYIPWPPQFLSNQFNIIHSVLELLNDKGLLQAMKRFRRR